MLDVDFALRSDRTMKALKGLSRSEFQQLCPAFDQALSKQMQSRRLGRHLRGLSNRLCNCLLRG